MRERTPITVITGPLGSGKTTLLRYIMATVPLRLAILMNEFGEIAIDSKIIAGKNVQIAELGGGCVCCSLLGEFDAAVHEIIATVAPEWIMVETTGVAEPDALVLDIEDTLPAVRLDGVVTVADADGLVRFPQLGHTTRLQIEAADLILLNKADLVSATELEAAHAKLSQLQPAAPRVPTEYCQVDPDLLFGLTRGHRVMPQRHVHQPEFESVSYTTAARLDRGCFEAFVADLQPTVYRAKGLVRFRSGTFLFNFVAGRWEVEPFPTDETLLVFIGQHLTQHRSALLQQLKTCEQ
jgi:G3E family GTPase